VSAVLRSESLKVLTVRTFFWVALSNMLLVFIAALTAALTSGLNTPDDDRAAAQIATVSVLLGLIAGILIMAGESSHGTITQTLLVTPIRERVFAAKAIVAAGVGLALAVIAELIVLVVLGSDMNFDNARRVLLGVLIAAPLATALGVGIGAIFQGQGSAIAVTLIWLLIGEAFAALLRGDTEKYTPGRAFGSLLSGVSSHEGVLSMSAGGFVAALWTALFLVAGALTLMRRDV
jgi:ABC-2 type transport system permease protein